MNSIRFCGINTLLLSIGLFFCHSEGFAQFEYDYKPIEHDKSQARELAKSLRKQGLQKEQEFKASEVWLIERYKRLTADLVSQVNNEKFILDDSLQNYLNGIMNRIVSNNDLKFPPQKILILRDPIVNGKCVGEGSIVLNNGLLAKLETKEQLAFVMSHEIAHLELRHVEIALRQTRTATNIYKPKKEVRKIVAGRTSDKGIEKIKQWGYNIAGFSRKMESQADSLGLVIYNNAFEDSLAPVHALEALDSALFPWYPLKDKLFSHLTFAKFPFNPNWTKPSLSLYSKEQSRYLFWETDSIETHLDIDERKKWMTEKISSNNFVLENHDNTYTRIRSLAQFENINSSLKLKRYDFVLYSALQLKSIFPLNAYLNEVISSTLLEIGKLKRDDMLKYTLSKYTIGFSEELRQIKSFIFKASDRELFELAYHFINNQDNFNKRDEEHYYLLWQISGETGRDKLQKKVRERYNSVFVEGEYLKKMK